MGPFTKSHILVLPTDFNMGALSDTNGVFASAGGRISISSTSDKLVTSYVIPVGMSARSAQFYGDTGVTVSVNVCSIENNTSSQILSGYSAGGGASSLSPATDVGNGLLYLTIMLSFGATSDYFHGGKIFFG